MFKILPASEKEFEMKSVADATPNWLKVLMGVFVALILTAAVWMDWAAM